MTELLGAQIPERPQLRASLQIVMAEASGRKVLVISDPEGWSEELIMLPAELAPILQYFDGGRTLAEIQEQLMRETQELVPSDQLRSLAGELDEHLLLDSERFRRFVGEQVRQWEESPIRPAILAGISYPADPEELRKFLDDFYVADAGPGLPGENRGDALKGIVAPHIELRGNGAVYAQAYKRLFEESPAELFIILGTGHHPTEEPLSMRTSTVWRVSNCPACVCWRGRSGKAT